MSAPSCIDCSSTDCTVLVSQERRVGSRLCTWQICPSCLVAYARETAAIKRDLERKALGKAQASTASTAKKSKPRAAQGDLA